MTDPQSKSDTFHALHIPGDPLILYNIWDAGSARAVAEAGAKAIATGSWSVAAAQGHDDGEQLPLDLALATAERIAAAVDLPVTIDFEGGYAAAPDAIGSNMALLVATGAIGCNFEDQMVGGEGLYPVEEQSERIAAARAATGAAFFINARTDLFLRNPAEEHQHLVDEACRRAEAYAAAGASGFFIPGLKDATAIGMICAASPLPVNVMAMGAWPKPGEAAALGVARISHGPGPYRAAMRALTEAAAGHYRR